MDRLPILTISPAELDQGIQSRKQLSCLFLTNSVLKAGGEEVAGLFTWELSRGEMVRIARF